MADGVGYVNFPCPSCGALISRGLAAHQDRMICWSCKEPLTIAIALTIEGLARDVVGPSQVRINAETDETYRPYCLACSTMGRMAIVERFYWRCAECGAEHDERGSSGVGTPAPPTFEHSKEDWKDAFGVKQACERNRASSGGVRDGGPALDDYGLPPGELERRIEAVLRGEAIPHTEATERIRLAIEERVSELFETNRTTLGCHDCGLCYGDDGWIECIVPDDVWRQIGYTGDEGGILCVTCIARRAKRLGLAAVPVMLCGTEVLKVAGQEEAFQRGWKCAERRIQELESHAASPVIEEPGAEPRNEDLGCYLDADACMAVDNELRDLRTRVAALTKVLASAEVGSGNPEFVHLSLNIGRAEYEALKGG